MLGGNLVKNYPVIDKFVNGVATSIKTLDVGAKSYLKGNNVFNKLKDYIDKLSSFKGREWSKIIIEEKDIKKKILEVGIPKGATKEQIKQINQAIKYAEQQGIKMNVRVVK